MVIDTATKYIYLSLIMDDKEVESVYEVGQNNHSVTIMPYINEILLKHQLGLKDIDEVIVGVGPGSYTGVRIGVTVAKMIGYLNQIKVFQVSSLALMASHGEATYLCPLIDARRGNAFMAYFRQEEGRLTYVKQDVLENVEVFQEGLSEAYQVITEGQPVIEKILQSQLLEEVTDVHALVPNYLQKTEAERNLEK